jgi:hypothetical protein
MALASDILAATPGVGTTGVAIGIITTQFSTTGAITRQAERFITATDSIEAKVRAVFTPMTKQSDSLPLATAEARGVLTTIRKKLHSPSGATAGAPAAMLSLAARAAFAPALSAVSVPAESNGVFRRAEAPA